MGTGSPKTLAGDIVRIAAVAALFVVLALLLKVPAVRSVLFDLDTFRAVLKGGDSLLDRLASAGYFVLIGSMLIALGVPRLWASAVGGAIYGAVLGTLLSIPASLFGAAILYYAGRFLLARVVERQAGEKTRLWQRRFQDNAFWWVLYMRLFPFSNSTLMSLFCGSCKVPFRAFLLGSLLGFAPLAVAFATFGSGGIKGNACQIGFATLTLVAFMVFRRFLNRRGQEKQSGEGFAPGAGGNGKKDGAAG